MKMDSVSVKTYSKSSPFSPIFLIHVTQDNKAPPVQRILICRCVLVMLCLFCFHTCRQILLSDQTNLLHWD